MGMGKEERQMQTITSPWGASYKGIGLAVLQLPDGTYQGVTQDGYRSVGYATTREALEDIKSHIDTQRGN
jgi:hypothetical protein